MKLGVINSNIPFTFIGGMYMKKIVFCIIIFFSFASVLAFSSVQINAAENRGTCGDNLTWSYDSKSRTLSITGTGKMYDFDYSDNPNGVYSPWNKFSKKIINVTFSKGITSVGSLGVFVSGALPPTPPRNSILNSPINPNLKSRSFG